LVGVQVAQPKYRFGWWIAVAGAFLAWVGVWLWQFGLPLTLEAQIWGMAGLLAEPLILVVDRMNWPYALALTTVGLAILLTDVVREDLPMPFSWAGALVLIGLGLLAVMADTPLVLLLVWAAVDLTDLMVQLLTIDDPNGVRRVILGFAARLAGIWMVIWAGVLSLGRGVPLDLSAPLPEVQVYLVLAAGLRLGVLPLHLGFSAESALRRGFGTALRLVVATSSLAVVSRLTGSGEELSYTPLLLVLVAMAGIYGGWNWLRASDALNGRPFWLIGWAALAVAAALRNNPVGATSWAAALTLAGATLSLSFPGRNRFQQVITALGLWGLSGLPFSPTASGWEGAAVALWARGISGAMLVLAQALLLLGFMRKMLWPSPDARERLTAQSDGLQRIYRSGIALPVIVLALLGWVGWQGALHVGVWWLGLTVAVLFAVLFWLMPHWRWLNPIRAHSIQSGSQVMLLDAFYRLLGQGYSLVGRLIRSFTTLLEGEGGMLWVLLFFIWFLSLFSARLP